MPPNRLWQNNKHRYRMLWSYIGAYISGTEQAFQWGVPGYDKRL